MDLSDYRIFSINRTNYLYSTTIHKYYYYTPIFKLILYYCLLSTILLQKKSINMMIDY